MCAARGHTSALVRRRKRRPGEEREPRHSAQSPAESAGGCSVSGGSRSGGTAAFDGSWESRPLVSEAACPGFSLWPDTFETECIHVWVWLSQK